MSPQVTRPQFPPGYVDTPQAFLSWKQVEQKLITARHYWLCSVRPDGRPHAVPRWAVWIAGKLYYDGSPETRHARNILENPNVTLHLESGIEAVIAEGQARAIPCPDPELAVQISSAYAAKYAELGYAPQADQWDQGGLYEFTPRRVIAWNKFSDDPTRFTF